MSERKQQTYSNHTRFDPAIHFFVLPVFLITWIATIIHLALHPKLASVWIMVVAFALLVLTVRTRMLLLRIQDRLIRLEERLRLTALLPDALRARIEELSERQLIALRFAPDAEAPLLVERTLNEKLSSRQIKQAIQSWKPDHLRV